jgi:hypothetical protein
LTAAGQATAPQAAAARTGGRGAVYAVYFLIILLLANTLSYADRHLFAILLPAIKADFGASDGVMGLIAGPGFIVSYILLTMPLARLADRWSRRRVLALSAATWSLATGLCGYAAGLWHLTAARVIIGVGEAGGMPPSQSMLADLFSERRRTTAMGVLSSGTYLGILLGLAGGAAIASAWGWRAAFWTLPSGHPGRAAPLVYRAKAKHGQGGEKRGLRRGGIDAERRSIVLAHPLAPLPGHWYGRVQHLRLCGRDMDARLFHALAWHDDARIRRLARHWRGGGRRAGQLCEWRHR